ncbi:MAG: aminodeoxychorismate/anthranilate synthase component II [Bacteroidia bacterium]|nr:aminodeoxychorismate/anthranilate synthase component II [Bacteroidia bacterium]
MQTLLIDNNDSFTYNIVNLLRSLSNCQFDVIKSAEVTNTQLLQYKKVILSPGPGTSSEFPTIAQTIKHCINTNTDLLGVCLGHQAICEYFGAKLYRMEKVIHGQRRLIKVDNTSMLYSNIPSQIEVGLYHSWAIHPDSLPDCLIQTAISSDNILMSVQHKHFNIYGVQFHPESFMTDYGKQIVNNFLSL